MSVFVLVLGLLAAEAGKEPCRTLGDGVGSQTIVYVRHGKSRRFYRSESEERVWLRLRNNTTCPITIPATMPFKIRKLPDGTPTLDPVDGLEVYLGVFVTFPTLGGRRLYHGPSGEGRLPAGQSVVFSVAANLLKRGPIAINFRYEWERSSPCCGVIERRIVFDIREHLEDEPELARWLAKVKDPPRRKHADDQREATPGENPEDPE